MKDFFKMVFACLAAFVLAGLAMMFFALVLIGILAAMAGGEPKATVPANAVLVADLSFNLTDAPVSDESADLLLSDLFEAGGPHRLQLRKVIDAIDAAAADDRIKAMFLRGSFSPMDLGSGYAAVLEMRASVERFAEAGKPVIAYLVGPSTRDYLLASAATRILLDPMGMVMTPGLSAEVMYLGGTLEKLGVGVQIAKAGAYKSAGESFVERHMSEAEREQLGELLLDVWGEYIGAVSRSRAIEPDDLQALIDRNGVFQAEAALEAGLVDELRGYGEVLSDLKQLTGEDEDARTFPQVDLSSYIHQMSLAGRGRGAARVAVVYAEGEIVDGEGRSDNVGGDRFARELRKLQHDDRVKAVVLRVNSPGGSAIASETIRRELVALHEKKPLVVSMGTVAASGGYWISTDCDRVFAQPNTITGSIGVVAILPNMAGLAGKIDLNVEVLETGRNAGIFSIARPRSDEAMLILQRLVDDTYVKFIDRVSIGREMERETVEKVAGGRVWSGADALHHGLVDEIGGLSEAIAHAADLAELDDYVVEDLPAAKTLLERLMTSLDRSADPLSGRGPAADLRRLIAGGMRRLENLNDPAGVYAIMPVSIEIR